MKPSFDEDVTNIWNFFKSMTFAISLTKKPNLAKVLFQHQLLGTTFFHIYVKTKLQVLNLNMR